MYDIVLFLDDVFHIIQKMLPTEYRNIEHMLSVYRLEMLRLAQQLKDRYMVNACWIGTNGVGSDCAASCLRTIWKSLHILGAC